MNQNKKKRDTAGEQEKKIRSASIAEGKRSRFQVISYSLFDCDGGLFVERQLASDKCEREKKKI